MKIVVVTIGTRGDVQPYVGVSRALMARGHEVTLATSEEHEPLVRRYGVGFRKMGPSFRDLMTSDLGRAWLSSADSPFEYARLAKELFVPLAKTYCEEADAAVDGADGVVFYMLAFGAMHAAQRRGLPAVAVAPWPIAPTGELAPPAALWLEKGPAFLKRWTSSFFCRLAFGPMNGEQLAHRARAGLPKYSAADPYQAVLDWGIDTVTLASEAVIPRPKDWAPRHSMGGYAFVPELPYEPPPGLARFLAAGPPPIYLGFGSMTGMDPADLAALATRAARRAGVRAVIATGWAELPVEPSDDVYVVDEIPHDWLFPRVSAVVHHGGASTLAEGLRAGKPTVIAAFFGDQPFWGRLNERLGTGPRALLRSKVTDEALGDAIRAALEGPYAARAKEIGERIRAENGADRAAGLIESALERRPETTSD